MVFLGGGFGACCRWGLSAWLNPVTVFIPYGTLLSNVLSCIVLGFFAYFFGLKDFQNPALKTLILTGFCGGFSTFSTFSNENVQFLRDGNWEQAALYTTLSLVLCNLAVFFGAFLGSLLENFLAKGLFKG